MYHVHSTKDFLKKMIIDILRDIINVYILVENGICMRF